MKTFKTTLTIAALGLVTLLTGCATPDTRSSFSKGDEVLYGRVNNVWVGNQMGVAHNVLCGTKNSNLKKNVYADDVDVWLSNTGFCKPENLNNLQQVQVIFNVMDANGNMYFLPAFANKTITIEKGDIVAVSIYANGQGLFTRPQEVLRVAAKAKDATKENGCYWDAGTGVWSGFNQGGAVCEGWHWKNHPFSNPKLLKQ